MALSSTGQDRTAQDTTGQGSIGQDNTHVRTGTGQGGLFSF